MGKGLARWGALMMICGLTLLAGCAKDIPYETLEARYADAQSRYFEAGGVRVHYHDVGPRDAPALVLVHGFSASLQAWDPWVERLEGDYRVVTLDLPGHGLTRTPQGYSLSTAGHVAVVAALADKLELRRFVIAGNSMGGGVAWNYALAHPDQVRGLVLVDAAGWPESKRGDRPPLAFRLLANPVGRALLRNINPRPLAEPGLKSAYGDPALVTPELVDRYVDFARAPGRRTLLTSGRRPQGAADPSVFKAIRAPTLIMHGADDGVIPVSASEGFASAIPGAKLIVYPGVAHVPMEQIPDKTVADLRAFLAGLAP